ncbi:MAG: hypothetical protein RL456_2133 [Pseudomonadota bacterium]
MSGGDWIGDFAGGWPDSPPPPPPPPHAGGARETVEIIICPKCRSRDVRCTKRTATHSHWSCGPCFHGWKEGPTVGNSKGFIA